MNNITDQQKAIVCEMSWANLFILHADKHQYGSFITSLQNDYLNKNNNYPTNMNEALSWLVHWKDPNSHERSKNSSNNGALFTNVGGKEGKGSSREHFECYNCHQKIHYSNKCPNPKVNKTGNINATPNENQLLSNL
jgi:hypothetical protein